MRDDLYRIVYCSRNLIHKQGSDASQSDELKQILHAARTNNGSQDVTGALLFNDEHFAQVLEGPKRSVELIFEKIQRDRRHGEVTMVENGAAEGRDFPEWAMAHVQPTAQIDAACIATTVSMALLEPSERGGDVLDLLKGLVIQD